MVKMPAFVIRLLQSATELFFVVLVEGVTRRLGREHRQREPVASRKGTTNYWAGACRIGAAFALGLSLLTTQVSAQNSQICSGYARDFAHRNTRGGAVTGAARGAIGGALIGGIANNNRGARRGARIGGATGAVVGGVNQSQDFTVLYNQAYQRCMRR